MATLLAGAFCFGPVVRARVRAEAVKRGFAAEVGAVWPCGWCVELSNLRLRPSGAASPTVTLAEVRIGLRWNLSLESVAATGGRVAIDGSPAELKAQFEAWRADHPVAEGGPLRPQAAVRLEGLEVTWRDENVSDAPIAVVSGFALLRDDAGIQLRIASARLKDGSLGFELEGATGKLDSHGRLAAAEVVAASVVLELAEAPSGPAPAPPGTGEPPPPPILVPITRRPKGKTAGVPAPQSGGSSLPLVPLPELHALRARLVAIASLIASRLPGGGTVRVDGLALRVRKGSEHLSLGPGPFTVAHEGDSLAVGFSTGNGSGGTPLSVRAEVPLTTGDLSVSLEGGPVSLSLLGVQEGAAGLAEVDRATAAGRGRMVLDGNAQSLTFDLALTARGLAVREARLADDTVRGLDLSISARGLLDDKGEMRIDDAAGEMGAIRVRAHGAFEQTPEHVAASVDFEAPAASCDALLESVPTALLPALEGARMSGTLGATGHLAFDTRRLDDLVLDYDMADRCRMVDIPDQLAHDRFTREFNHQIYQKDGTLADETTGPDAPNWTELDRISPFVQAAVLTTEDGAFFHHHGFNHAAIRNALITNLKARRFIRGASTITMQLAKNLFLSREKTVSRKLEELILTDYLEQAFTKEEMMELYLNIIEFGPDIYGITAAADHYFGRKPDELNLAESLFLSSILPAPIRYHKLWEQGEVPESWMRGIHDRMEIAERTGKITAPQLAEGLAEPIVFHRPDQPRPPPRPPIPGMRRDYDESQWQELN